ncbi:MAG TPA: sigma-70 family RNA polymerase sigma factor [Rhizomicrobium sp.]|jgi:RNA polymerase sigma-70 factor (ECF subfamily)|nr:sigma-70 family RNA polymerase sigma factor [Rhizomicrobium sp.]
MDDRRRRFEAQALPHLDAAYNLARWLSRSPTDADDIVQDAMLRAFRAFDGFRGGDVKAWLLTIVRNCWASAGAASRRRGHTSLEDETLVAGEADPEQTAMRAGTRRRLDQMIAALPEEFREVLILREMEDMSYREIADITGTPIGTVMSRLARARAMLRETAKACL